MSAHLPGHLPAPPPGNKRFLAECLHLEMIVGGRYHLDVVGSDGLGNAHAVCNYYADRLSLILALTAILDYLESAPSIRPMEN